jgi:prolyl-tRNA synthetase
MELQVIDGRLAHLNLSNPTGFTMTHLDLALTVPSETSTCPSCSSPSSLKISKAIEIGHTFHLGTRYSAPLNAQVLSSSNKLAPIAMGCHGIGVSRLLAAAASQLMDSKGLNWPVKIAPFTTVVVAAPKAATEEDLARVYDVLAKEERFQQQQITEDGNRGSSSTVLDVTLDDRDRPLGWKLRDADLIGYPFIVVLGKAWKAGGKVELQCRRLEVREEVLLEELGARLRVLAREL